MVERCLVRREAERQTTSYFDSNEENNQNSPVAGSKKARTYLKMMRVIILFGSLSMSARYLQSYQASQARPGDGNE